MNKIESDWCKKIEIWWLLKDIKKYGGYKVTVITWGDNGSKGSILAVINLTTYEKYVRFKYTLTDPITQEMEKVNYKILLLETPCNYGKTRYWFECPLCHKRRVGVLYKCGDYFGCRHCHNLTYSSRNENKKYKYYPLYRILEVRKKIEKKKLKIKRISYRGRPTKKLLEVISMSKRINNYYQQNYKSINDI